MLKSGAWSHKIKKSNNSPGLPAVAMLSFCRYFIRKERGLVRDPKTLRVGPKRNPDMRYTELADDMVTDLGRIGQKVFKVW